MLRSSLLQSRFGQHSVGRSTQQRPTAQRYRLVSNSTAHRLRCTAAVAQGPKLSFHIGETTIAFPFSKDQAQALSGSIRSLLETFAEKQRAERPKRWNMMEYRLKGDPEKKELQLLEVFCNPNAHATAFDAKVLITMTTADGVKLSTEGRLSNLKADVDTFLEQA